VAIVVSGDDEYYNKTISWICYVYSSIFWYRLFFIRISKFILLFYNRI